MQCYNNKYERDLLGTSPLVAQYLQNHLPPVPTDASKPLGCSRYTGVRSGILQSYQGLWRILFARNPRKEILPISRLWSARRLWHLRRIRKLACLTRQHQGRGICHHQQPPCSCQENWGQGYPEGEEGDLADLGAMRPTPGPAPPTRRDREVEELRQVLHKVMDRFAHGGRDHKGGDPRAGKEAGDSLLLAKDSSLPGPAVELPARGDHRERGPQWLLLFHREPGSPWPLVVP